MPKITCSILTYNEENRIATALAHARHWADEILVLDKSSADRTRDLAIVAGAKVVTMPFTRQGHENYQFMYAQGENDWTWVFTPGEVPTREVIHEAKGLIASDSVDAVGVRHKYYSFGMHHEHSPWSWSFQPRLFHRGRCKIQNVVHNAVTYDPKRAACCSRGYVLHQTHATVPGWFQSHVDYMAAELESGTPEEIMKRAARNADSFTQAFSLHPELYPHKLAWRIYWMGVALYAWEKQHGRSIPEEYRQRADEVLKQEWGFNAKAQ